MIQEIYIAYTQSKLPSCPFCMKKYRSYSKAPGLLQIPGRLWVLMIGRTLPVYAHELDYKFF